MSKENGRVRIERKRKIYCFTLKLSENIAPGTAFYQIPDGTASHAGQLLTPAEVLSFFIQCQCHVSDVSCLLSAVTCQLSVVTYHMSPVSCQMSAISCHQHQQPQPQTLCLLTPPLCTICLFAQSQNPFSVSNC